MLVRAGKAFRTHDEAVAYASVLAAELWQDGGWDGFMISIADNCGGVVAEIPIRMQRG
jgi:hypothetical protein